MNMHYCAFENTYRDLRQAMDKLEEQGEDEDLGPDEAKYRRMLVRLCQEIVRDYPEFLKKD